MSAISKIPFREYDSRPIADNQNIPKNSPVDAAQAANAQGTVSHDKTAILLDKFGPAYKLDGSLPEVAGKAETIAPETVKKEDILNEAEIDRLKRAGEIECQTCKNRTYQDKSNDPAVSFKAPGYVPPGASYAVVASHEGEHAANEQSNAQSNGRKIVSQSVQIFMTICPECGKAYVSGGLTKTTTASGQTQALDVKN